MSRRPRETRRNPRRIRGAAAAFLLALPCAIPPIAHADETQTGRGSVHALLINGGQSPQDNAQSHLHHLQDMVEQLLARGIASERIHVFSSDGADPEDDLAVRDSADPRLWLLGGTDLWQPLNRVDLTNTTWAGVDLQPARLRELRRFFVRMSRELVPGDTLFVFVTDHGTANREDPGNASISLWNESLSVLEFRALLAHLQPGVRVVDVMSQCYSGSFADAMSPLHSPVPTGDVCGFYSTTASRPAYGCYPEGRDHDRLGHAFEFIDAMARHDRLNDAHLEILATDKTPDVPLRTSDFYLARILEEEAAGREVQTSVVADELLVEAWNERGRWEPEIRLLDRIGAVYRTFSPRSFAELQARLDGLEALSTELSTYGTRWKLTFDDLRRENLARFLEARAGWSKRLERDRVGGLTDAAKKRLLDDLLPELEQFSRSHADTWERLETLRERVRESREAEFRVEIRLAALHRMRSVLMRVAARQLIEDGTAGSDTGVGRPDLVQARLAFEALAECEETTLGRGDGGDGAVEYSVPEPLPPFEEDLAVVDRVLPSWLGIRFQEAPGKQREALSLQPGAVVVQQVYEDSGAARAGIRVGDVVLGPPGLAFGEPRQIREWIMGSPRDVPLRLELLREGAPLEVSVELGPYPLEMPRLPEPPGAGDTAPPLTLVEVVTGAAGEGLAFESQRHLLFFWATWCGPCKQSVPELLAWSAQTGTPVVALSDESASTVKAFLDSRTEPFPEWVLTDEMRLSYVSYGVSGTPTFVLVGADGRIEWRQTGYGQGRGLEIEGWDWSE